MEGEGWKELEGCSGVLEGVEEGWKGLGGGLAGLGGICLRGLPRKY